MKTPIRLLIGLLLVLSTVPVYSQTLETANQRLVVHNLQHPQPADSLIEEFSFVIKDFKVEHQGEHNVLNISVLMRYLPNVSNADYPDYRAVAKDIETFLTNYPSEQDYWEIVNKGLTSQLLKKYSSLAKITCEITVDPVSRSAYTRSSRVTRERANIRSKTK
jgi:hypothetical protein